MNDRPEAHDRTPASHAGKLIVFEGPDGVGKSTLAAAASEQMTDAGVEHDKMSFPGRRTNTLGALVYEMHHDPERYRISEVTELARQTLHIAAHLDVVERTIRPALKGGRHVILDRFWWSTWVYGRADGVQPELLEPLLEAERRLWHPHEPAAVVLVGRDTPMDRPEEVPDRWCRLVDEYRQLAGLRAGHHRVHHLDNEGSVDDARGEVRRLLEELDMVPSGGNLS